MKRTIETLLNIRSTLTSQRRGYLIPMGMNLNYRYSVTLVRGLQLTMTIGLSYWNLKTL